MKHLDKRSGEVPRGWSQNGTRDRPACTDRTAGSPLLRAQYVPTGQVESWVTASSSGILAVIHYDHPSSVASAYPSVSIALPQLGHGLSEVWTSALPVEYRRFQGLHVASNTQILFGRLEIEEPYDESLRTVSYEAYGRMITQAHELGYPHLVRVWNYFPRINSVVDGFERYQHFCMGRHQALAERLSGFPHVLPAGTAIGTQRGPFQLHFLASVEPGIPVENPRQISAYHYPREYGPSSPSFARATLHQSGSQLYISGTASVVGHATQHAGDVSRQAAETVANLKALIDHVERTCVKTAQRQGGTYKIYVRHPQHLDHVRKILQAELPVNEPPIWLQGDLCRRDLLLEIEGVVDLH